MDGSEGGHGSRSIEPRPERIFILRSRSGVEGHKELEGQVVVVVERGVDSDRHSYYVVKCGGAHHLVYEDAIDYEVVPAGPDGP